MDSHAQDVRLTISESDAERMIDAMLWRRLDRDPRYADAENAEDQADAEQIITAEIMADLGRRYVVDGVPNYFYQED